MKKPEIDYFSLDANKLDAFFIGRMLGEILIVPNPAYHRHNFHEIIWLKQATGTHDVDGVCLELLSNSLSLIRKGQVHRFNEVRDINGYFLRFTDDFLPDLKGQEAEIYSRLFALSNNYNPLVVPDSYLVEIEQLVEFMAGEYFRENSFGKKELIRHFLLALLIKIDRLILMRASTVSPQPDTGAYQLFESYLTLLEEYYRLEHNVDFYAGKLQVSPRQLSNFLQQKIGKSPKRLIVERLLLEAKRLLSFTELSIKEIANSLGYNDPYHFSKLFKQETGLSPRAFRNR